MKLTSTFQNLGGGIEMPDFAARPTLYMHKTSMNNVQLPDEFRAFGDTIESALRRVKNRNGVCYLTLDEKLIEGTSHRRGGAHCDFNWFENVRAWSTPPPTWGKALAQFKAEVGAHGDIPGRHGQPAPAPERRSGSHGESLGRHGIPMTTPEPQRNTGRHGQPAPAEEQEMGNLLRYQQLEAEWFEQVRNGGMLLVSNHPGCQVYAGDIVGEIGEGGCCANVDLSGMATELMPAGEVYYLNSLGIHESLRIEQRVQRTLMRLNFHPDYVFQAA